MEKLDLLKKLAKNRNVGFTRFNKCNAYISNVQYQHELDIRYQLIMSYDTIVAIVLHDTREYIELGKWSVTTSKQVTVIYRTCFYEYDRKYMSIR